MDEFYSEWIHQCETSFAVSDSTVSKWIIMNELYGGWMDLRVGEFYIERLNKSWIVSHLTAGWVMITKDVNHTHVLFFLLLQICGESSHESRKKSLARAFCSAPIQFPRPPSPPAQPPPLCVHVLFYTWRFFSHFIVPVAWHRSQFCTYFFDVFLIVWLHRITLYIKNKCMVRISCFSECSFSF